MSNAKVNQDLYASVSLMECADLIARVGTTVTVLAQGELGIGKSSMLKVLRDRFPNHHVCYFDMTTKDVGDFAVPKIRTIDGIEVCSFLPNEEFGFHLDRPVIVMLDELGKSNKAVLNASLRIMLERKLGVYSLPEGSIVFATTNLAVEGLGDLLPPHVRNRVSVVRVRKPKAEEWVNWAMENDVAPEVLTTVEQFPQMLASFEEYSKPEDNEYINDPRVNRPAFVTPRSLEKASDLIKAMRGTSRAVLNHALTGTIGKRATYDMTAMIDLGEKLPTWDQIVKNPAKASIPTQAPAKIMLIYQAVQNIDRATIEPWMTYVQRLPKEMQALFCSTIIRTSKAATVASNRKYLEWAKENRYLYQQN